MCLTGLVLAVLIFLTGIVLAVLIFFYWTRSCCTGMSYCAAVLIFLVELALTVPIFLTELGLANVVSEGGGGTMSALPHAAI